MKARLRSYSIRTRRFKQRSAQRSAMKQWSCARALRELRALGEQRNIDGMARFGIRAKVVYGVAKPKLDLLARRIGKNHALAQQLWASGVHDARLLAVLIDEPERVTAAQMDRWAQDFDNWDVCDGTCCHLFGFAAPAWKKAQEWSQRKAEFEKRASFALMAYLAVHDKKAKETRYLRLLPMIRREANDERNFVRKAVNWALRQIGKRNLRLNRAAVQEAERIQRMGSRPAQWIATDALRELRSKAVVRRLRAKELHKRNVH
jgi:3-methyladenine DNA glycosylase AlkD